MIKKKSSSSIASLKWSNKVEISQIESLDEEINWEIENQMGEEKEEEEDEEEAPVISSDDPNKEDHHIYENGKDS